MMKETKSQPTRLQWLWLHLGLLHRMLRLAAEGLVVAVLVLAGLVQSLRLISWWDRGIEVEHLRRTRDILFRPKPVERTKAHYELSRLLIISWFHYKSVQLQSDERALKDSISNF